MAPVSRIIFAVVVLLFAIVSLVFSILGIVSKEWAVRDNFNTRLNVEDWSKPLYTLYRSPFQTCSVSFVNTTNTTTPYRSDCEHWKPFGFAKTSCESANATGDDTAPNIGDTRLCQQIHYAGNFAISSTALIGLAVILTVVMTVLTILDKTPLEDSQGSGPGSESHRQDAHQYKSVATEETHHVGSPSVVRSTSSQSVLIVIGSYVGFFVLTFFAAGTVTALIAQLYAILGFTMSLPNNSDFSSSSVGSLDDVNTQGSHGPWYQGKALSVYWTCAWAFALAAGLLASRVWTLPRWKP